METQNGNDIQKSLASRYANYSKFPDGQKGPFGNGSCRLTDIVGGVASLHLNQLNQLNLQPDALLTALLMLYMICH